MRKYTTYLTAIGLILVMLTVLTGCGGGQEKKADGDAAKEIRIGAVFPLTGSRAAVGQQGMLAVEIAAEMQNEMGGIIGGKKIVLIKGDAKDPEAAASEAERLISVEKIKLMVGTISSSVAAPAIQVAARRNVFYYEVNSTEDTLTQRGYKYLVRYGAKGSDHGIGVAKFTAETLAPMLNKKPEEVRYAVVRLNDAWGTAIGGTAATEGKKVGLNVVADITYDASSVDFKSIILKVKDLNPDVVCFSSYNSDGVQLFQTARELGLNANFIGTGTWSPLLSLNDAVGSDANYIFDIAVSEGVSREYMSEEARKISDEFIKRYKARSGNDPSTPAQTAFWPAWVLFHNILTKANEVDVEKIRALCDQIDIANNESYLGNGAKFVPAGQPDAGQNTRALVTVRQRMNNQLYVVYPPEMATIKPHLTPDWGKKEVSNEQLQKWLSEK